MLSPESQVLLAKPTAAGTAATVTDKFWFKNRTSESVKFGVAVLGGTLLADLASKKINGGALAKSLESRLTEVGLASAGALAIDTQIFQKERAYELPQRVAAVAAAEVAGERVANTFLGIV